MDAGFGQASVRAGIAGLTKRSWRQFAALGLALCMAGMAGCEVDSFMDPSRTGRFEFEPTTIPVLDRIDVIEPREEFWTRAQPPTYEDLVPRELEYRIYPGDVITVGVFELNRPSEWTVTTRRVDTSGSYRIPELGEVRAAGLTAQQFEEEINRRLIGSIFPEGIRPQIDVVIEQSGGLRYTVYGFVSRTGQYGLDHPNLRLVDALANSGGAPTTTERVFVIRQIILSPEMEPSFQQDAADRDPAAPQPQQPPPDIEDLLRELEESPTRPRQPETEARPGMLSSFPEPQTGQTQPGQQPGFEPPVGEVRPGSPPVVDIDQLEPVRQPTQPPIDVDVVRPPMPPGVTQQESVDSFMYDVQRGEWIRIPGSRSNGVPQPPGTAAVPAPSPPAILDRVIVVDYQALLRGDSSQNIVIRPNDQIYVEGPIQGFFYIDGEISRPGVFQFPNAGTMTLSRAITTAGGFNALAIPSRIDLTRKVGHNLEATVRLDVAAIRQRTEPDIILKPDDHIIVGTSFLATPLAIIRNGFRATYGFGFLLDRNFGNDVFGAPPENLN